MLTTLALSNGQLSQSHQDQYWCDGYLFPLSALDADFEQQTRIEFERMEQDWLSRDLPHPMNTYKRVNAHVVMPMAARIAQNPGILDVIEGILGPDILIYSTEFFIKEPRTTQVVSMHQDLTYWGLGAIDGLVAA